jgi:uroporphyrinogen decarboxylase
VEDQWHGDTEGTRRYTKRVIQKPSDWEHLPALDPTAPQLARQLECLRLIRAELGPDTPLLQTIFNPLSQAKNLAGNETLLAHLRLYPEAVMKGLATIAESTHRFVEACIVTGIDGVFYAVQHAQASLLTLHESETCGLPYDIRVLEPARELMCNLLHLHGRDIYFSLLPKLHFPIVNWHDRETYPSLAEAQELFTGVACGGLRQDTLVYESQTEVQKEAADAIQQTGGKRFMLGTGCVVPIIAPHGNILAARTSPLPSPERRGS